MLDLSKIADATQNISAALVHAILLPFRRKSASAVEAPAANRKEIFSRGPLVLIGGDRIGDEAAVRLIHLSGGRGKRYLALVAWQGENEAAVERFLRPLRRFGVEQTALINLAGARPADAAAWAERVREADCVLLGADDAGLLMGALADTGVSELIREASESGKPVAAVGAAAPVLGETASVEQASEPRISPGLALLPRVVVDRHGPNTDRLPALFFAVCREPQLARVALGLDQSTAAVIDARGVLEIVGHGLASVVDAGECVHSAQLTARAHRGLPSAGPSHAAIFDARLHLLPDGFRYHLIERRPLPPALVEQAAGL